MAKGFRMATEDEEEKEPGMDLSMPMTIAELIAIRAQIIRSWEEANAAIEAVDSAFHRIHDKDFYFHHDAGGQRFEPGGKYDVKAMTEALDYSLFVFTLGKLNITNAMTENAKDKFLASIKEKKTAFDETQLTGLVQNAHKLFRDSSMNTVRQVYSQLIGSSYRADTGSSLERKKDNLQKVEKIFRVGWSDVRLTCSWAGEWRLETTGWRHGSASSCFHFNDLLTACRLIEGDGIPDYSNNLDCLIRSAPKGDKSLDTGYFVLQAFQNGNVRVKWNEDKMDVLDKLNAIGSGRERSMPDTMRKRYKPEHFHDGGAPNPFNYFRPDPDMQPSDDKDFAFYPTQDDTARRMVHLAEYGRDMSTLEPSAGDGALVRFIGGDGDNVAVEFNHHRAQKLRVVDPIWAVYEADFLKWETQRKFDRVMMNPPFNDRVEAVHVVKAFGHLKPGGILVGIIPEGWFTRGDQKATVFRTFLQTYEYKPSEKLPAGSFKRTKVETRIIILQKPMESPK